MQADEQERHARYFAWLVIAVAHAGIFWLLSTQRSVEPRTHDEPSMRLLWLIPPTLPRPAVAMPAQPKVLYSTPTAVPALPASPSVEPAAPAPAATVPASTGDLLEQGRAWARQPQAHNDFRSDPLRSRRAQLPGGERAGSFRMQEPMSPARAMENVAKFFGDPGPPCPRAQARLHGLLTATSDKERALLQEELRRVRQFCH